MCESSDFAGERTKRASVMRSTQVERDAPSQPAIHIYDAYSTFRIVTSGNSHLLGTHTHVWSSPSDTAGSAGGACF